MDRQTCVVIVEPRPRGGSIIPIAFDPVAAWGDRDEFYVHGTIQGRGVRGSITRDGQRWIMSLGPAWCRDAASCCAPTRPRAGHSSTSRRSIETGSSARSPTPRGQPLALDGRSR
jgi:hypothetical protein